MAVKRLAAAAVNAADIGPVATTDQTQSPFDLFLIFVGANVVATTFQVGASLRLGPGDFVSVDHPGDPAPFRAFLADPEGTRPV